MTRAKTTTVTAAILTILLTATVVADHGQRVEPSQQPQQEEQPEPPTAPPTEADETSAKEDKLQLVLFIVAALTLLVTALTLLVATLSAFFGLSTWKSRDKADQTLSDMQKLLAEAEKKKSVLDTMTAEIAAQYPEKADAAARASKETDDPIDRAIAEAIKLQANKQYDKAKEKWLAIANLTKDKNNETAARAHFSAAWLIHEYDNKYKAKDKKTLNDIISLYDQVLEINPDNVAALNNRGIVKSDLRDHDGAIQDFNQALKIKPDNVVAYCNRGSAKSELGKHKDAIEDVKKAMEIEPDNESLKRLLAEIEKKLQDNK